MVKILHVKLKNFNEFLANESHTSQGNLIIEL